ncbi:glutaredoxin family protein [Bacillus solimangrovi]|uniref:Glutaredoxin n=1 Tax=Bacillus solimangrovi TaxID=1305675 RepID=A0A1E5LE15_9BACI|nr:glutaredoxin family protein [Bacillus solimangrovi]OEH92304.1 glutaredoxin [Bacillus solimangrovi]
MKVVMYSRKQCPLCEKAKIQLLALQTEFQFEFEEVDIYENDSLLERYQLMIPVVEINGEEVEYGQIVKENIRKRLLKKMM